MHASKNSLNDTLVFLSIQTGHANESALGRTGILIGGHCRLRVERVSSNVYVTLFLTGEPRSTETHREPRGVIGDEPRDGCMMGLQVGSHPFTSMQVGST